MDRNVIAEPDLSAIAQALAQPSRASMLQALMAGVALPASELAYRAGVSNATASSHLRLLVDLGLIRLIQSGRHRYYELANHHVAGLLETLSVVAPKRTIAKRPAASEDLRSARLCYDHLAGGLGVAVTDALLTHSVICRHGDHFEIADGGWQFLRRMGVDRELAEKKGRRAFAQVCVDWSERRPHVAGTLGAAIASRFIESGWVARNRNNRALTLTSSGKGALRDFMGITLPVD